MKKYIFSSFLFFFGISQLLLSQKNLDSLTADADWREYYDYVSPFEDGYAIANVYGKQVLLDKNGRELIPLRYYEVSRYVNNVAWVRFDAGWGAINRKGKVVVPFQYSKAIVRKNGLWVQKNDKWGFVNRKNKVLIPFECAEPQVKYDAEEVVVARNNQFGVVDGSGKVIVPFIYEFCYFAYFNQHFIVQKKQKYGVIDKENQIIIPFLYDGIEGNQEDVYTLTLNEKKGLYKWKEKFLIPAEYNMLDWYGVGACNVFMKDSTFDAYFPNGKVIKNSKNARSQNNYVTIENQPNQWSIYDKEGNLFSKETYDESPFYYYFSKAFFVSKNKKKGLLSTDNQMIIPFEYDYLMGVHQKDNNLFIAKKNGKFGLINKQLDVIIPFENDSIGSSLELNKRIFLTVTRNGKQGIYDLNGKALIPITYDLIRNDYRAFFQVFKDGKWTMISHDFINIAPKKFYKSAYAQESYPTRKTTYLLGYNNDETFDVFSPNQKILFEGASPNKGEKYGADYRSNKPLHYIVTKRFLYYQKNGKFGATNYDGDTVVPFVYDNMRYSGLKQMILLEKDNKMALFHHLQGKMMTPFYDSIYVAFYGVLVKKNGKYGLLNWNMQQNIPCEYDELKGQYESQILLARKGDKYGLIDARNNQVVFPFQYFIGKLFESIVQNQSYYNKTPSFLLENKQQKLIINGVGKSMIPKKFINQGLFSSSIFLNYYNLVNISLADSNSANSKGLYDLDNQKIFAPCEFSSFKIVGLNKEIIGMKTHLYKIQKDGKDTIFVKLKKGIPNLIPSIYDEIILQDDVILLQQDSILFIAERTKGKIIQQYKIGKGKIDYDSNTEISEQYFSIRKDSLCAIFTRKEGVLILPFEYENINAIRDTFIASKGYKYGLLTQEKCLVPYIYEDLKYYNKSFFIAEKNKKKGIINADNQIVVPFEYDQIYYNEFDKEDPKIFKEWQCGYLNKEMKPFFPDNILNRYQPFDVSGFSNTDSLILCYGNSIIPLKHSEEEYGNDDDCGHGRYDRYAHCKGFMNLKGDWVIPVQYWDAKSFEEGLAPVQSKTKWGYINLKNERVIPCQYDDAACFKNGFALVQKDSNYYFINKKGEVSSPIYINTEAASNNWSEPNKYALDLYHKVLPVLIKNGKVQIDSLKIEAVPEQIQVEYAPEEQLAYGGKKLDPNGLVTFQDSTTQLWGVKNPEGKIIVVPFSTYRENIAMHDSMIMFYKIPFHYLLDYQGNTLEKNEYGFTFIGEGMVYTPFSQEYIRLKNGQKKTLNLYLDDRKLGFFENGFLKVNSNIFSNDGENLFGLMDKNIDLIIPLQYQELGKLSESLIAARKGGKWGYINLKNETIIPFFFDGATDFKNGLAIVKRKGFYKDTEKYTIINSKGEILLPFMFDNLQREGERYFKFNDQIIDEKGRVVRE